MQVQEEELEEAAVNKGKAGIMELERHARSSDEDERWRKKEDERRRKTSAEDEDERLE